MSSRADPQRSPRRPRATTRVDIVQHHDGLDSVTMKRLTIAPGEVSPQTLEAVAQIFSALADRTTFEGAVREIETYWTRLSPPDTPDDDDQPPQPWSIGWYAVGILSVIDHLRRAVKAQQIGQFELVKAIELGGLVSDARWRVGRGSAVRLGVKTRRKNKQAAASSVSSRQRKAASRDRALEVDVDHIRRAHPRLSEYAIASRLLSKYSDAALIADRTKARDALRQKIRRLKKKPRT